jgi:hypothetical protein
VKGDKAVKGVKGDKGDQEGMSEGKSESINIFIGCKLTKD